MMAAPEDRFGADMSESRVEAVLDGLPTAVLLFDGTSLRHANPAARALLSLPEHPSGSLEMLASAALADAVAETAETGMPLELEVRHDGRHLAARTSVTAEGEVSLVLTDLTDIRRVEALRRDFVTNASHELKTPVAGIQALAESLQLALDRSPDRARTMVQRLLSESERLSQLVRDLLDLARVEEAEALLARERVDLSQLLVAQVERLAPLARKREVTVHVDDAGPVFVVGNRADFRLIVSNLLDNAVRYNRAGGQVQVRLRRDGDTAVLEVSDSGPGIPEGDLDRVFERFYRVDKARSRADGGTGLGLSIVRHAVARHGGAVTVASTLGEGSTFRVTLPIANEG